MNEFCEKLNTCSYLSENFNDKSIGEQEANRYLERICMINPNKCFINSKNFIGEDKISEYLAITNGDSKVMIFNLMNDDNGTHICDTFHNDLPDGEFSFSENEELSLFKDNIKNKIFLLRDVIGLSNLTNRFNTQSKYLGFNIKLHKTH